MITVSQRFQLNWNDMEKIGKGLLIALAGAALTYLTEQIPNIDLGEWTPIVVAIWSVIVNAAKKWLSETRYIEQ